MKLRTILFATSLLIFFVEVVIAAEPIDYQLEEIYGVVNALNIVAGLLAILMLTIQGVRWLMAESPQQRADIKQSIIYILLGLLVVMLAPRLVCVIYCKTIQSYDPMVECSLIKALQCKMSIKSAP